MKIQVINFEICKDHYQITRMLKKTPQHQLEYTPFHLFEKQPADVYLLISRQMEAELSNWCRKNDLPPDKIIVLSDHALRKLFCWQAPTLFEKELDFEKICRWLIAILEKDPSFDILISQKLTAGKIRKEHDLSACIQAIRKQHPQLENSRVFLFVKEKSPILLGGKQNDFPLQQVYLKGIADTYDYLIFTPKA